MIRLRPKDIDRLSVVTGVPSENIMKLASMGLISHGHAVDLLIKYSYKKLKLKRRYTPSQIIEALMCEYGVSRTKVQSAMYSKKSALHYCSECMKQIPASTYKRNNGLCDSCLSKHIQIEI